MRRVRRRVTCFIIAAMIACILFPVQGETAGKKVKTAGEKLIITDDMQAGSFKKEEKLIKDITPREPAGSDLAVMHTVTKLSGKRWIQSFTFDSKYYYYLQMINPYKGHLRVTRVLYTGGGKYKRDYMDLKRFGHGTNLDCSVIGGVTWLWTGGDCKKGSDISRSVTGFRFVKGKTLRRHGEITYKIRKGNDGDYVTNVYPAISQDSKEMAVRFTWNHKQYFQFYDLVSGRKINPGKVKRQAVLAKTGGDFQGFDIYKKKICTIEGSPRKSFLRSYDASRVYEPTIIRTYDMTTKRKYRKLIYGAAKLSFREPEGIHITASGKRIMMYVSHLLEDQSANIYRIK